MKRKKLVMTMAATVPTLALMVAVVPALAANSTTPLRQHPTVTSEQSTGADHAKNFHHPAPTPEQKQKMDGIKSAIENNDYDTFKSLIAGSPFEHKITDASAFAKLVAADKLRQAGDEAGARALLKDAGLILGNGQPHAVRPPRHFQNLTDDQKAQLEEARKLFNSGDKEAAKAIFDEIRNAQ